MSSVAEEEPMEIPLLADDESGWSRSPAGTEGSESDGRPVPRIHRASVSQHCTIFLFLRIQSAMSDMPAAIFANRSDKHVVCAFFARRDYAFVLWMSAQRHRTAQVAGERMQPARTEREPPTYCKNCSVRIWPSSSMCMGSIGENVMSSHARNKSITNLPCMLKAEVYDVFPLDNLPMFGCSRGFYRLWSVTNIPGGSDLPHYQKGAVQKLC